MRFLSPVLSQLRGEHHEKVTESRPPCHHLSVECLKTQRLKVRRRTELRAEHRDAPLQYAGVGRSDRTRPPRQADPGPPDHARRRAGRSVRLGSCCKQRCGSYGRRPPPAGDRRRRRVPVRPAPTRTGRCHRGDLGPVGRRRTTGVPPEVVRAGDRRDRPGRRPPGRNGAGGNDRCDDVLHLSDRDRAGRAGWWCRYDVVASVSSSAPVRRVRTPSSCTCCN